MTLTLLGSVALISLPNNIYSIITARGLIGLGHGCAYLTALIHASEVMTPRIRGMAISGINLMIVLTILISGVQTQSKDTNEWIFGAIRWMGITGVVMSFVGMLLIHLYFCESPVKLIREKRFNEALLVLIKLRNESVETQSVRNDFEELRSMVDEDELSSKRIFDGENMMPLQLITLLKIGSVIAFNYCVNIIRLKYSPMSTDNDRFDFTVVIFMAFRLVGCFVAHFTIDTIGRRLHYLVSFGGSSLLLIAMSVLIAFNSTLSPWIIGSLQFFFEFVGGLGIGMISDVYASEAFNTVRKAKSIAFATGIEMTLHAVIIAVTFSFIPSDRFDYIYLSVAGILVLVITIFIFMKLPETARMTIRQTRAEFSKVKRRNK